MSKQKKKRKTSIVLLLLAAALLTVIIYRINDFMSTTVTNPQTYGTEPIANIDEISNSKSFNTLLIATDAGGLLTDTIMLVNVNRTDKTISMVSIPRDTKVKVNGKNCKINSCYAKGGMELLIEKVKDFTGVPINYYALINPGTLAKIVDCLGGVRYNVERDMKYSDPSQDLYIDLKAGEQTLNGDAAEQYCRFRSYAMGDIERTNAQKRFLKAFLEQKLNMSNIIKIKSVYEIITENVITNVTFRDIASNISVMTMLSNADNLKIFETHGQFNDVKKEGTSYYIIDNASKNELHTICAENFSA